VAGLWGNNGSGHVRGASVEEGMGPGVECIGVRLPGGRGRAFWQFPLLFLRKMVLVCFIGSVMVVASETLLLLLCCVALCYVCPSTVLRHVSLLSGCIMVHTPGVIRKITALETFNPIQSVTLPALMSFIFLIINFSKNYFYGY